MSRFRRIFAAETCLKMHYCILVINPKIAKRWGDPYPAPSSPPDPHLYSLTRKSARSYMLGNFGSKKRNLYFISTEYIASLFLLFII